jgi:hypothetical protein
MLAVLQMKKDLVSYILADPTLAGLIVKKLYQSVAAENATLPYIVYYEIGGNESTTHDGPCLADSRVQFDCVGSNSLECEQVAEALYALLAHPGKFQNGLTDFQSVSRDSPGITDYETATDSDGGIGNFRKSVDYQLGWAPINQT